ncbi:MAG: TlpA family protein disulfide reductase [bacterium]|nr:TlpA family protein disulfide reductase [bacterium]
MNVKKIIIGVLIFSMAFVLVASEQEDLYREIVRLYGAKQYDETLKVVDTAIKKFGINQKLLQIKYNILVNQEKYPEALTLIAGEIKRTGETEKLVSAKYNLFFRWGKLDEALKTAKRKFEIAKNKSPWDCMNIMHVYLRMGNKSESLDWLQEAVSRGFIEYRLLKGKRYELLVKEKRFYEIIETIKAAVGLGNPARNFTVKLLSGEEYVLAQRKGKVVLVDFWATWCDSCREEMPHLKKLYQKYKDKDFEMLGISLDSNEQKLREYVKANNLGWKISFSGDMWKDATVVRYGVNSIPSLWLIDKKGTLRSFGLKGKKLHEAIDALLIEK